MTLESKVEITAGVLMLASLGLARWLDERWVLLAVFVGLNLIQSPITGFCAMESLLKALGARDHGPGGSGPSPGT